MVTTAEFLRIVALILGIIAVLLFLRSLLGARRAGKAAYYSTRREASRRAIRYLTTSLIIATIAVGIGIASIVLPPEVTSIVLQGLPARPPAKATSQPTIYMVPTLAPTAAPDTPTSAPTPSATPLTTIRKSATPVQTPAINNKYLTLRTIASAIDASGKPISSTAEFSSSVKTVYVFFDYADVPQGVLMRQTWFLNGGSVHFDSTTWARTGSGTMYIAWSPPQGFNPGLYEVRVLLGDLRQFSANFMVH